jgi:hypothetical protein
MKEIYTKLGQRRPTCYPQAIHPKARRTSFRHIFQVREKSLAAFQFRVLGAKVGVLGHRVG